MGGVIISKHKLKGRYIIKSRKNKVKEQSKVEKFIVNLIMFCVIWFFMTIVAYWFIKNTWLSVATFDYPAPIQPTQYDFAMTVGGFILTCIIYIFGYILDRSKKTQ